MNFIFNTINIQHHRQQQAITASHLLTTNNNGAWKHIRVWIKFFVDAANYKQQRMMERHGFNRTIANGKQVTLSSQSKKMCNFKHIHRSAIVDRCVNFKNLKKRHKLEEPNKKMHSNIAKCWKLHTARVFVCVRATLPKQNFINFSELKENSLFISCIVAKNSSTVQM